MGKSQLGVSIKICTTFISKNIYRVSKLKNVTFEFIPEVDKLSYRWEFNEQCLGIQIFRHLIDLRRYTHLQLICGPIRTLSVSH